MRRGFVIWRLALRYGPTIAAALAVAGGGYAFYAWSWNQGHDACRAEQREDTARLNARLAEAQEQQRALERELAASARETQELQQELDDEARNDPNADRRALGAGSVRRIEQVR